MKFKRSERLVDIFAHLKDNPSRLIALSYFTDKYGAAKSTVSEDISILKDIVEMQGLGLIRTFPGAKGGVMYSSYISEDTGKSYIEDIIEVFSAGERILPGGYVYLSDIIGMPDILRKIGRLIASQLVDKEVDCIMTVATKGIPLAYALAYEIDRPVIIARNDPKLTEGATVSVKYTSESLPSLVRSMEVAQGAIKKDDRIVLVDDFYRGGGTMKGMEALIDIFQAELVASFVLCENVEKNTASKEGVKSIIRLTPSKDGLSISQGSIY